MKKSHKVLLALLGIIVLAVAGFKAMQPKEPVYQGRKLSEWMAFVSRNPAIVNPEANEALYAMRHEALPIIERNLLNLEHIGKAPAWKKRLWNWQIKYKIGAKHTWWHHYDSNLGALRVLGTNAIPVLEKLSTEPKSAYAYECMGMLAQAGGIDELIFILEHSTPENKAIAASSLGITSHQLERVIPALYQASQHPDQNIAKWAIISLSRVKNKEQLLLPVYQKLLASDDWWVRMTAVQFAGNMETNTQALVPSLMGLLTDEQPEVRMSVVDALDYLQRDFGISTNIAVKTP